MEDTAIIRLFQERSQQAIAELSQKYGKLCQSLSRRILNNEEDAKECVNDTWLGVWNSIPPQTPNPLVSPMSAGLPAICPSKGCGITWRQSATAITMYRLRNWKNVFRQRRSRSRGKNRR